MDKLKGYLDTSVISHLLQKDDILLFKSTIILQKSYSKLRAITNLKGYKPIEILNPSALFRKRGMIMEKDCCMNSAAAFSDRCNNT